jgi:hypothetical protein
MASPFPFLKNSHWVAKSEMGAGFQGVCGADTDGVDVVRAGSETRTLCQGTAEVDVYGWVFRCHSSLLLSLLSSPLLSDFAPPYSPHLPKKGIVANTDIPLLSDSPSHSDDPSCVCPGRHETVALHPRQGDLRAEPAEPADLPAQSGLFHRFRRLVRPVFIVRFATPTHVLTHKQTQGPHRTQPPIRRGVALPPPAFRAHLRGAHTSALLALAAAVPELVDQVHQHARCAERGVVHTACVGDQLQCVVCGGIRFSVFGEEEVVPVVE